MFSFVKSIGTSFSFSMSIISTSAFKLARFDFSTNLDVPIPIAFF